MQKRWLVMCAFLAVGCGDKWDKPVKDLEGFKDKMCACKDKACTDRVRREQEDWQFKMLDSLKSEKKPPTEVMEKVDRIEREMRECRHSVDKPDVDKASDKPSAAEVLGKMTELKDSMCACKDPACAKRVNDASALEQQGSGYPIGPSNLSDADAAAMRTVTATFLDCLKKANGT